MRRKKPLSSGVIDEEAEQQSASFHALDLELDFTRAVERLSSAEQTVLLHCVQIGLSQEETAYVLDMPLGTVKTHATRGKAKLKTWLADWNTAYAEERSR
jgi:RNA polymerase sigma-70 factor (ECF subfamily)